MNSDTKSSIPELRFSEFNGDWVERRLGDSFEERVEKNRPDLPLLSLGEDGLILQSDTNRKDNSNSDKSKYLKVAIGDIAYNTMRMWQGRCVHASLEGIVSPAYTICKPKADIDGLFHYYLFKTPGMIRLFHQNSQGLVSDTLNLKFEAFSKLKYYLPPTLAEQQKIAECLSAVDESISAQQEKVDTLKTHKKGLMQQLFPQAGETTPRLRFPGFSGEWEEKKLGDVLDYEQPTPYLVSSESYLSEGIPVLTAGKTFVLGYTNETTGIYSKLPVIIFDDFVMESKYVTFPFKAKSSAMKMLSLKNKSDNLYFMYILMTLNQKPVADHKRHWISETSQINILVPSSTEQQQIALCLTSLDEAIAAEEQKVEALKMHKRGLMQQLFPSTSK